MTQRRAHPLVIALQSEARRRKVSRRELARRSGVGYNTIACWNVNSNPCIPNFVAVLNSLGLDLAIVPREGG